MSRAGPVTILAADPHGPAETERRRAAAAAHGGRWLEGAGGGRSLAFADVIGALSFAKQIQRDDGEPIGGMA